MAQILQEHAELTLFTVDGDPRSQEQVAGDAALARRLADVRELAASWDISTTELANLALVASGNVRPIDLQAKPHQTVVETSKWGFIFPRFSVGTKISARDRNFVPEDQRSSTIEREERAWRFEISKLIPSFFERSRFVPEPVRRWLGANAICMEIGPIKERDSQLEKRMNNMHKIEGKTEEDTEKALQAQADQAKLRAAKQAKFEDKAYRPAAKAYLKREEIPAKLNNAEVILAEAEANLRRNPSYAAERAVALAREARDRVRIAYEKADGKLVTKYLAALAKISLREIEQGYANEKTYRQDQANRQQRKVVTITHAQVRVIF